MKIWVETELGQIALNHEDLPLLQVIGMTPVYGIEFPDPRQVRLDAEAYEDFCNIMGCESPITAWEELNDLFEWYCSIPAQMQDQAYFEELCGELWNCK